MRKESIDEGTIVGGKDLASFDDKKLKNQSTIQIEHSAKKSLPLKKRHLPIAGKKKIFDEWGAVM